MGLYTRGREGKYQPMSFGETKYRKEKDKKEENVKE
jgi:hypothetical protein